MNKGNKKIKTLVLALLTVFTLSILMMVPSMVFAQEEDIEEETVPEELSFDISYPEIRARAGQAFEFRADLNYQGDGEDSRTFDITWEAPEGWNVSVKPAAGQAEISALNLDPGSRENLSITATPLVRMQPDEYPITVIVQDEESGLEAAAEFKAIITAFYELDLRTKTGRLSTEINSGQDNRYNLLVENKGTAPIENLTLAATPPEGWNVDFEENEIEILEAGATKELVTTIRTQERTIAGDYMVTFNATSANSTDSIDLRVTVLTPTIWGWLGVAIIVVVIGGVAVIFARLGRR